jgi:hypothetical protein
MSIHEATSKGDPCRRSVFSLAIHLAVFLNNPETSPAAIASGRRSASLLLVQRFQSPEVQTALDCCSLAVGKGGEQFAHCAVKMRVVEGLEAALMTFDQLRLAQPVSLFRFLTNLSFYPELQLLLARRSSMLEIILDHSGTADERGVLALLIVRNLCAHSAVKAQMCQDHRVLFTLRSALLAQGSVPQSHITGGPTSPSLWKATSFSAIGSSKVEPAPCGDFDGRLLSIVPAQPTLEILQRQECAVRALWLLAWNNQRGKAYVRGLLQGISLSADCLPEFDSCGDAAKRYRELIKEGINGLRALGL